MSVSVVERAGALRGVGLRHRGDIQAMRGLAAVAYAANHVTPWLPGALGFMDMFFTISGYLITLRLILLAERGGVGHYFAEFYKFRARRLFPAAFLTLALTVVVGYVVFIRARAHAIAIDSVWALLFVSNIRFTEQNTDYFHRTFDVSPLLAFWSLSVEEQFYLVWPVVVLVVLWIARRRGWATTGLVPVAALIAVASFGYALWATHHDAVSAYYSTLVRAWDFAVGAILADIAVRRIRVREGGVGPGRFGGVHDRLGRHASVISWVGLSVFLASQVADPHNRWFPAPWAVLPVVGAGLVIYAGIDHEPRNLVLNNRLLAKLGDISYSFYLLLFPVLVFAEPYLGHNRIVLGAFVLTATLALSLLLFHLVEEPGRRGLTRTRQWIRARSYRPVLERATACAVTAVVVFVIAARPGTATNPVTPGDLTTTPTHHDIRFARMPDLGSLPATPVRRLADPDFVRPTKDLGRAIAGATGLTAWPRLTNAGRMGTIGYLGACDAPDVHHIACVSKPATGVDPSKVALAVGDSTMNAYAPMLNAALVRRGWTVVIYSRAGCPGALLRINVSRPPYDVQSCRRYHAGYAAALDDWKPSLVLVSDAETTLGIAGIGNGARTAAAAGAAYAQGLGLAIRKARQRGANVVVLSPPPLRIPISSCDVAGSSPQACVRPPDGLWLLLNTVDRQVSARTGARYADLLPLLCSDLRCPPVVGGVVVASDDIHLTPEYARWMAPSFGQWLGDQGIAP